MNNSLTFEEYSTFLSDFAKLQLFFAWQWGQSHPDEPFEETLRNRVNLCRKTDPEPLDYDIAIPDFERPEWLDLEQKLTALYNETTSADEFERKGYSIVEYVVDRFTRKTFGSTVKISRYQCGSLKYDEPKEETPTEVMFHIGNAIAPKSIFSEREYLVNCILDLMKQTEEKYGADTMKTSTWLNSLPKWLEYFPEEWQQNLSEPETDIKWHFGFWGQFVSAKGTLNYKYADQLRKTGELLYYPRSSHCSFDAMKEHCDKLLKQGLKTTR